MKQHPMVDTLISDADGIHRPGSLNDRLGLGLKRTMNEAEPNILLVRPDGGIRTKAAPGELCGKLSIGFLWVDEDAEVLFNHHAAVTPIKTVFERFAKLGYACRVWLWFHTKGLNFPKKPAERSALLAVGRDFQRVWYSATTTVRDQKELPRAMLEEVRIAAFRDEWQASLILCLRGGHPKEIDGNLPRPASDPTNGNTLSLLRQLPALLPEAVIAGNLNWQGRTTAWGLSFIGNSVSNLRRQWEITRFETHTKLPAGELLSLKNAVKNCRKVTSTLNRWKNFCSSPISHMLNRHMNITASERGKIRHVLSMVSLQNSGGNITSVRQRPRHAKPSTLNLRISFTAFPFRSSEKEVFLSRSAVFQMSSEHGCTRECINLNFPVHDRDVAQKITPILGSCSDFISDSTPQYVAPRIPGYNPFHMPLRRMVCENRCSSLAGRSHPLIPRQIRRTNKLRQCFVKEAPAGYS